MRNIGQDGLIKEPTSERYGMLPNPNAKRERFLMISRWFWLLIPIAGIVPFTIDCDELTDEYGHYPWWL